MTMCFFRCFSIGILTEILGILTGILTYMGYQNCDDLFCELSMHRDIASKMVVYDQDDRFRIHELREICK